jgi:hypothetical protein
MIALLLAIASAPGADRVEAEHDRLSSDLQQLSQRQLWAGAEKKYQELTKLGVDLTFEDLMNGAYAARALGSVQDAYTRLKAATKLKDNAREVVDWLYAIDANYGKVELLTVPPRSDTLAPELMPFDPDQRTAVEAAVSAVKSGGVFSGLLPKGSYTFAGQQFTVEPGISVRIEVSPRLKKTQGEVVNVSTTPTWGAGADTEPTPATPK